MVEFGKGFHRMGWAVVYALSFVVFCCEFAAGVHVVEVYRMIQYESAGTPLGAQRTQMHLFAKKAPADLTLSLMIVRAQDLDKELLLDGISNAAGILVIFEKDYQPEDKESWQLLENYLVREKIDFPVYFCYETPEIQKIYEHIPPQETVASDSLDPLSAFDRYSFIITNAEAKPIDELYFSNFESWLYNERTSKNEDLVTIEPTIAIIAHYDTFGIAPGIAVGTDSNGSGLIAVLELARVFSKLYSTTKTQGKYNIVFVLTSAGRLNFLGSKQWVSNLDPKFASNIEFALCIDSIGSSEDLYLHISRPAKDDFTKKLYADFHLAAEQNGIQFETVHKKINMSDPVVYWEHEQFSRKRVISATISGRKQPRGGFDRGDVFDSRAGVDVDILLRNIKFLAEALVKHVYGFRDQHLQMFNEDSLYRLNEVLVEAWLDTLAETPRVMPYLRNNSRILRGLTDVLRTYVGNVKELGYAVEDPGYVFYGNEKVELSIYKVKPLFFDALVSLVIGLYLLLLYIVMKGPRQAIKNIIGQ